MKNTISTKSNTGYKGIHFREKNGKQYFETNVVINKPNRVYKIHTGNFDTLAQAKKGRLNYLKSLS